MHHAKETMHRNKVIGNEMGMQHTHNHDLMSNDATELRRESSELSVILITRAVRQKLHTNKKFTSARSSNQINDDFLRVVAVTSQFSFLPRSDRRLTNTLTP